MESPRDGRAAAQHPLSNIAASTNHSGPEPERGTGATKLAICRASKIWANTSSLAPVGSRSGPRVTASVTERFRVADKFNYPTQLSSIDRDRRVVTFSPAMFVTSVISGREM